MDDLAHGVWSYTLFHETEKPHYAVFWGLAPDIFSWMIYLVYQLFSGGRVFQEPTLENLPSWVLTLYGLSHSLFVYVLTILIVFAVLRRVPIYMHAWAFHILIDIPTHSTDILPTPFLWPLSEWKFPGIAWGTWWFVILNYIAIFTVFIYVIRKKRVHRNNQRNGEGSEA